MNFLFDLIHFHSYLPFVLEGVSSMEEELIIMSTLIGLTNSHSSFPSVLDGLLSMEDKLLACHTGLTLPTGLVNSLFDLTHLQTINSLFDSILYHIFYLEIIAVSILFCLLIFISRNIIRPRPRPCPPAPPNTPEPGKNPNLTTYSSIGGLASAIERLRYPSPERDPNTGDLPPAPPNTPEPQPGQPQPGQPQPGQPQPGQGQPPATSQGQGNQTTSSSKEAVSLLGWKFAILSCKGLTLQKLNFVFKKSIFNLSKIINIDTLYNYRWGHNCFGSEAKGKALFFCLFFLLILGYIWNITNLITNFYNPLKLFFTSYEGLGELESTILTLALYPTGSISNLSQAAEAHIAKICWGERVEITCQTQPFFIKLKSWIVGWGAGNVLQGDIEGFMKKNVTTTAKHLRTRFAPYGAGHKKIDYIVFLVCCVAEELVGYYNITFSFEGKTPFIKMSKSSENDNDYAHHSKGQSSWETETETDKDKDTVHTTKNVLGSSPSTTSPSEEGEFSSGNLSAATTESEDKNPALRTNSSLQRSSSKKDGDYAVVENEGCEKTKTDNSQLGVGYWSDFDWSWNAAEVKEEKKNLEPSKNLKKEEEKSDDSSKQSSSGWFIRKTEPEQETEYDGDVEDFKASDRNSDSDSDSLNVQAPNNDSDSDADFDFD
jgi:hypothetical protein